MKYSIMSKYDIINKSKDFDDGTIVISINGVNERPCNICTDNLIDILYVYFDDVIDSKSGCKPISDSDATLIAEFVRKYWISSKHLVVHCGMGVSRSPACMSAILQANEIDDSWIWSNVLYTPNTLVVEKVLRAFGTGKAEDYEELWRKLT